MEWSYILVNEKLKNRMKHILTKSFTLYVIANIFKWNEFILKNLKFLIKSNALIKTHVKFNMIPINALFTSKCKIENLQKIT